MGDSGYPPSLAVLAEGVSDASRADKVKMYFLRRIPRDPLAPESDDAPEQSWGLRSYASEPDDPAPRLLAEFPAPGAEAGALPAELLTLVAESLNALRVAP